MLLYFQPPSLDAIRTSVLVFRPDGGIRLLSVLGSNPIVASVRAMLASAASKTLESNPCISVGDTLLSHASQETSVKRLNKTITRMIILMSCDSAVN